MDVKTISSSPTPQLLLSSATATATRATSSSTPCIPFATLYAAIERIAQTFRGGDPSQNRAVDDLNDALQSLPDQAVTQESQAKLILRRLAALPPSLYPAISLKQLPRLMPVTQAIKQLVADWFASPARFPPAVMMRDFDRMQALLTSAQFSHLDAVVESSAQYLNSAPALDYKAVDFAPFHRERPSFCYHVATVYSQHAEQELQSKCRTILEDQRFREADFQKAWERRKQYQRIFQCKPERLHQQMPSLGHWSRELSRLVWEYVQEEIDADLIGLQLGCEALLAEVEECTATDIHRLTKLCNALGPNYEVLNPAFSSMIIWLFIHTLKREEEVKEAVFQLFYAFFGIKPFEYVHPKLYFNLAVGLKLVIEAIRAEQIPNEKGYLQEIGRALRDLLTESQLQRAWRFQLEEVPKLPEGLFTPFIPFPLTELRAPQTVLASQHVQAYREYAVFYQIDSAEIAKTALYLQERVIQDKSPFAAEILAEMLGSLGAESRKEVIRSVAIGLGIFTAQAPTLSLDYLIRQDLSAFLRDWEKLDDQQKQKWDLFLILYVAYSAEEDSLGFSDLSPAKWIIGHSQYATYRFFACLQSRLEALWNNLDSGDISKLDFLNWLIERLDAEWPWDDMKALQEPSSVRQLLSWVIDSLNVSGYTNFVKHVEYCSLDHRALLQLMRRLTAIQKQPLAPLHLERQLYGLGKLIQKCRVSKAQRAQWVEEMHRELQTLRAVLHAPRYKLAEMQKVAEILQEIEQDLSRSVGISASS